MLLGDFNSTDRTWVYDHVRSAGLIDSWVEAGRGFGFTFPGFLEYHHLPCPPILRIDRPEYALAQLADARFDIVGLDAGAETLFEAALSERVAVVVGNETTGISQESREYCSRYVSLPLAEGVESLNVASAAAVLCYELVRRRASSRPG